MVLAKLVSRYMIKNYKVQLFCEDQRIDLRESAQETIMFGIESRTCCICPYEF